MSRREDEEEPSLDLLIREAFEDAYPDITGDRLIHMSRNFTQVMRGIVDIGERVGSVGEVSQMDVANGLVYSCVVNTRLEDLVGAPPGPGRSSVTDEDFAAIVDECVARVSDWLLALKIAARAGPEVYRRFVKDAVYLGASDWKRDRSMLEH